MRISRTVEEWLETDSGDLRIYMECDEKGIPVRVNSVRFVDDTDDDGKHRVTREFACSIELLERTVEMVRARRVAAGDLRILVCGEHGRYDNGNGPVTLCELCHPETVEVIS